jgi:predicted amidohydrolase YtcJ
MRLFLRQPLLAFASILLASNLSAAPAKEGHFHVRVTDPNGVPIPGARVEAESRETGQVLHWQTDAKGDVADSVAAGNYTLNVRIEPYDSFARQLQVKSASNQLIAIHMTLTGNAPEINVTAPASPNKDRSLAPDLILYHGTILTGKGLDGGTPLIVSSLSILDGKVLAIGSDTVIRATAGAHTQLRDLHGAFVMPGLNDAHVHLGGAGRTKLNVDLTGAKSLEEMLAQIKVKAEQSPAGHWLTGGNWDHTLWADKTLPSRQDLDRVTGDHPALLERIDGHIAVANSAALRAAGITGQSKAPLGGAIDLDANGQPTGILRDTEMEEVEKIVPGPTMEERRKGLELAINDAVSHGLTSVQDNSEWDDFLVYEQLEKEGKLKVRISEWLPFAAPVELLKEHRAHHDGNDPMLHTGMLKGFMDGSLGSRTAAMKAPYSDDEKNSGLPRYEQAQLNAMAVERAKAGFQIGFHAIGDRAAAMALEAFSQTYDSCSAPAGCWKTVAEDHRDRIEHAQVVDPADIARFKTLGVVASMQPNHLLTDMNWAMDRLGQKRAAYSYAWKAYLDAGVPLAFGTDYPVEPVTPFRGIYAAVTRANEAGTKTYFPENRLTVQQALYAYTQGSAYAEFAEKRKGKLMPGFEADYILLDRDLLTIPAAEILGTKVIETVVGGKTVYRAQ